MKTQSSRTGLCFTLAACPSYSQGKTFLVSDNCLQHAFSLHHSLCSSLLLAYKGLFDYFTTITKDLPSSHRMELGICTPALQTVDRRPVQFTLLVLDSGAMLDLTFSFIFLCFKLILFLRWCFVACFKFVVLRIHFTWSLPVAISVPLKRLQTQRPLNSHLVAWCGLSH